MKYCSACGASVEWRVLEGGDLPRYVCSACKTVHYQNPKVVVGCIPEWEGRILLCRRAIQPRHGMWTLPAGFMENDETTAEGAARETMEEASARVDVQELYALFNLPHVNQIYVMYRASLLDLNYGPGPESLEVGLYAEKDIPWERIAFPVITETLHLYYEDRRRGSYGTHSGDIIRVPGGGMQYEARFLGRR